MRALEERFESKVDRSGEHHRWTGACDSTGTPQMRVDGRLTTARRVAWALAHGPLPDGVTIAACPGDSGCVRIDHLRLGRRSRSSGPKLAPSPPAPDRQRRRRSTGSMRELRPGVWELTVTPPGHARRQFRTVRGSAQEASDALGAFIVESGGEPRYVETLVVAYLMHLEHAGRRKTTLRRYRQLWRDWLAPSLDALRPGVLTRGHVERCLAAMAGAGQSHGSIHQAAVVLSSSLAWAVDQGHLRRNPVIGARLPDGSTITAITVKPAEESLIGYGFDRYSVVTRHE